jgi:hypothetical protein
MEKEELDDSLIHKALRRGNKREIMLARVGVSVKNVVTSVRTSIAVTFFVPTSEASDLLWILAMQLMNVLVKGISRLSVFAYRASGFMLS